jgi:nicotinic acid mononucleotide adenylyltransferase
MDRMKEYKQLIKELSSKTVVFAFGRFNPPTIGHELLVKAVKKLAQQRKADHVIYASRSQDSKKNPLSVEKKVKYLKLMFPNTNFAAANDEARTFIEVAKQLNKKYKNIIMVGGSDRVQEFKRLLSTYNGKEFNFDTIDVVSAGERDPDADDATGMSASKMRQLAVKGNYAEFKKGLPSSVRDIDGKRLMNDIREGMGVEPIKEQINLVKDELREKYFRGEIFNEGDLVESNGETFTIVKRGSNHLLVKESSGKLVSKWIQDVKPIEEKEDMNEELTDKTLRPTDKIKVARIVATMLGVDNAEASSSPENLINQALRKVRTKALNPEALKILDKMLSLATEVGINYDATLKPTKLKEAVLGFNSYNKNKESEADTVKDTESDHDYEHQVKVTGVDQSEVGHTLVAAGGQDNLRRRKVKYHLGEEATDPAEKAAKETAKATLMAKQAAEKEALATKQAREKESLSEAEYTGKGAGKPGWMLRADPKLALKLKTLKKQRKFVPGTPTKTNESLDEQLQHHEEAVMHKELADKAKNENRTADHHAHMADHHEAMGQWHESKGRHLAADRDYLKAVQHHNASVKSVDESLDEKVGVYKKFMNGKWVTMMGNTIVKEEESETAPHNTVDLSAYEADYDIEMDDLELSDEEIDHMVDSMSDDEIADDYDEDEVGLIDDETGEELPRAAEEAAIDEESIMEVLSRAERMKAKFRIRRSSAKRERATKVALKRYSNTATINKRARRLAIKLMKKRLLRGRDPAKISVGEKERIERTLEKRKVVIGRVAQKLTSRVRKVEKARLSHTKYTQGTPNVTF